MTHVLDTNVVSHASNRGHGLELEAQTFGLPADASLATTDVTAFEIMRGRVHAVTREPRAQRQAVLLERLAADVRLLAMVPLLPFSEASVAVFEQLRPLHRRTGSTDLKIAAICLAAGAALVTGNVRDFREIDGLEVVPYEP